MTQVKTDTLPVGRYYIDVADFPAGKIDDWNAFVSSNAAKVSVESTQDFPEDGSVPHRIFAIFNVSEPVFFPQANFGPPSTAPTSVTSEADTEKVPDPEPAIQPDTLKTILAIAEGVAFILGVKTVLDLLKELRGTKT